MDKKRQNYIDKFQRENYDRVVIKLPKGSKQVLQSKANELEQNSVTRLIINALEKTYKIDLSNPKQK